MDSQHAKSPAMLLACAMLLGMVGCGGQVDQKRLDIEGTVTFRGQPVPKGRIDFIPDASRGAKGPAGFAIVEDGHYSTSNDGRAVVAGPLRVRIQGFDGAAPRIEEGSEFGNPLFETYTTRIDVSSAEQQYGFRIP